MACNCLQKNITKSKSFRTKVQAVAWANKIELEIVNNLYRDVADIPFQQVIERYLKEVTPNKRGAKKEIQFLYRFLALPISQISLKDLREEDFQSWRDERLKKSITSNSLKRVVSHRQYIKCSYNRMETTKNKPTKSSQKNSRTQTKNKTI